MINQILPLLNNLVPSALALRGLSKVNPKLSTFIQKSVGAGYVADEILDFLRDRFSTEGQKSDKSRLQNKASKKELRPDEADVLQRYKDNSKNSGIPAAIGVGAGLSGIGGSQKMEQSNAPINFPSSEQAVRQEQTPQEAQTVQEPESKQLDPFSFLSGYSPELASFIKDHLSNGRTPEEAAALAKIPGRHGKLVKKIESDTKENFVDLLSRLFGGQKTNQTSNSQASKGSGDTALLAALDKILKM